MKTEHLLTLRVTLRDPRELEATFLARVHEAYCDHNKPTVKRPET